LRLAGAALGDIRLQALNGFGYTEYGRRLSFSPAIGWFAKYLIPNLVHASQPLRSITMRHKKTIRARCAPAVGSLIVCATASLCFNALARLPGAEPARETGVQSRQKSAAAILEKYCVECHGRRLTRGGLDLTTREGLLKGGAGGAAFLPGEIAKSPLYERITHTAEPGMPYKRQKLGDE
jgi:hypothetical protein